jgi:hypothetical protein
VCTHDGHCYRRGRSVKFRYKKTGEVDVDFLDFFKSLLGKQALSLAFVEIHFINVYMSEPVNETVPFNGFDF